MWQAVFRQYTYQIGRVGADVVPPITGKEVHCAAHATLPVAHALSIKCNHHVKKKKKKKKKTV